MTYTRRQWATDLLHAIGNVSPDPATVDFVAGWTAMETTEGSGAQYNLLNTEQQAPGSTNFNPAGVQNFPTYTEGIQTNAQVLENGLYNPLLVALQTNDRTALGLNGAPPSYGVQRSLTNWVKGPNYQSIDTSYVNGVIGEAEATGVPGQTFPDASSSAGNGAGFAPQVGSGSSSGSSGSSGGSTASGMSLTDVLSAGFQSILLVIFAIALIILGLYLLFKPAVDQGVSNIKVVSSGDSGQSAEDFTESAGAAQNGPPQRQSQTRSVTSSPKKSGGGKKQQLATAAKAAAVAP